jgi:uncharacterized Zn finger protein (UPF0148 family)
VCENDGVPLSQSEAGHIVCPASTFSSVKLS